MNNEMEKMKDVKIKAAKWIFYYGVIFSSIIWLIIIIFFFIGCVAVAPTGGKPRYYNEENYDKAKDFSGVGDYNDLARIKNQRENLKQKEEIWALTKEKLKSQPVLTKTENGAPKGLKGIVANFANYRVNIVLRHKTVKSATASYVLEAGARTEDYLIPGEYEMITSVGGEIDGHNKFSVGAPQYSFLGEKVHWYAYYDPRALRQKRYDRW